MKKTAIFATILLFVLCSTPSVFGQKKDLRAILLERAFSKSDKMSADEKREKAEEPLQPWLQKPYLMCEPEKATVRELSVAVEKWRKENMPTQLHLKDDEFAKFQRKLHLAMREGDDEKVPITANERMDAYANYAQSNAAQASATAAFNIDPNWKPLGPNNKPDDIRYNLDIDARESRDNIGLGRINCIEFATWDAKNLWAGTSTGGVWKSWDSGKNWNNISTNLPISEISDIAVDQNNSNIIYVATGDRDGEGGWYGNGTVASRLYKTTDGGNSWFQITADFGTGTYIEGLYTNPRRGYEIVVVKASGVYKSVDGGANWTKRLAFNGQTEFYVANAYANQANIERLYAVSAELGAGGAPIFWMNRSDDFGTTWRRTERITSVINSPNFNLTAMRMSVAPTDANCVYLATQELDVNFNRTRIGAVTRTLDGGRTWQDRANFPMIPNLLGFSLGDSSDIDSQGDYNFVLAVDPKNRDRVYVGGVNLWGSTDGGQSFSMASYWQDGLGESAHGDHHWAEFSPITGEFFLATDGGLYKTNNLTPANQQAIVNCYDPSASSTFQLGCYQFPTKWEFVGNGMVTNEFYAIEVSKSNPDIVLGGAQDNGTVMLKNAKWQGVFSGDGFVPLIHPTNPNNFFVNVQFGPTVRTRDGGKNYTYVTAQLESDDQGNWYTPMALAESNPNTIIQARRMSVWRTTNQGDTWQVISNFPQGKFYNQATAMEINANGNTIWVARATLDSSIRLNGVLEAAPFKLYLYKTTNGGTTWTNMWSPQFPSARITDIALHPTNPNKIWVTFSAGYSPTNPNQSKKVFYSADAGATWTNITEGLPPAPVWTVAISAETYDDGVYVGTGMGVYYRDSRTGRFIPYQNQQMPKGTIITDLKIHAPTRRIYAGTHGHGIWRADLYDNPQYVYALRQKVDTKAFLGVSPNPTTGLVKVTWDNDKIPVESLKITDLMGREVYADTQFKGKSVVDMSAFSNGIYLIQLKTDAETVAKKIVLEK
jgi:photosystem II stability/assembly factor-like uncharacterized protein